MPIPLGMQGHGDDGALREVLDRDAERQRQCAAGRDLCRAGSKARIDYADRHALRNIVQRHSQHHHRGAGELASGALGLAGVPVQVRDHMVQHQQERDAQPEADKRGQKRPAAEMRHLLHGRDQQAPDRRCNHNAGGKAG